MKPPVGPQTRWAALWALLGRGMLWGAGLSLLCALLGLLILGRGWAGALTGLNVAGTALCLLAGLMLYGAVSTQGAEAASRGRLGDAAPRLRWPLVPTLVALIAAGVCFGLAWVGEVVGG